jgi:hypothetical protein
VGDAYYDIAANNGKGGYVTVVADPEAASQSRKFAVVFFTRNLEATVR